MNSQKSTVSDGAHGPTKVRDGNYVLHLPCGNLQIPYFGSRAPEALFQELMTFRCSRMTADWWVYMKRVALLAP